MNIFLFGMNTFYKWGLYQRNKMLPKPFLLGFSPALTHWHFNSNANDNHHFSNKPNFRTISFRANYSKKIFGRVTTNGDWVYNQGFKYMFFHSSCEAYLRASVATGAKIMSFCHTKCQLYYFTTSFYNISFIRCFIIQFYTLK